MGAAVCDQSSVLSGSDGGKERRRERKEGRQHTTSLCQEIALISSKSTATGPREKERGGKKEREGGKSEGRREKEEVEKWKRGARGNRGCKQPSHSALLQQGFIFLQRFRTIKSRELEIESRAPGGAVKPVSLRRRSVLPRGKVGVEFRAGRKLKHFSVIRERENFCSLPCRFEALLKFDGNQRSQLKAADVSACHLSLSFYTSTALSSNEMRSLRTQF